MKIEFTVDRKEAVKTQDEYKPMPAGMYEISVKFAEMKTTKTGKQALNVCFVVEGPTHSGRVFYDMFVAFEGGSAYASKRLNELCIACGMPDKKITDSAEFQKMVGVTFEGELRIKNDTYQGKTTQKNEIIVFKKLEKIDELPF